MSSEKESGFMIVHVPHSSIDVPPDVRKGILLDDNEPNRQILMMTEWFKRRR